MANSRSYYLFINQACLYMTATAHKTPSFPFLIYTPGVHFHFWTSLPYGTSLEPKTKLVEQVFVLGPLLCIPASLFKTLDSESRSDAICPLSSALPFRDWEQQLRIQDCELAEVQCWQNSNLNDRRTWATMSCRSLQRMSFTSQNVMRGVIVA